jgi:hypothetical protein
MVFFLSGLSGTVFQNSNKNAVHQQPDHPKQKGHPQSDPCPFVLPHGSNCRLAKGHKLRQLGFGRA